MSVEEKGKREVVSIEESMLCAGIREALIVGRQAVTILEALPEDEDYGYDKHEELAQYAAVDRLIEAFRKLDRELIGEPPKKCEECLNGEHAADGVDPICPCCSDDVSSVR